MDDTTNPSPKHTIWVIRHGERADECRNIHFAGNQDDPPLTPRGIKQAQLTGHYLAKHAPTIRHIFCSPFRRTIETANEIAKILNVPIKLELGLSECFFFSPNKVPYNIPEIAQQFPLVAKSYKSLLVYDKSFTNASMKETISKLVKTCQDEDTIFITHRVVYPQILSCVYAYGGFHTGFQKYCAITKLVKGNSASYRIETEGYTGHLNALKSST